MAFKTSKDYFKFSREQRKGVFIFFTIIIILQLIYFLVDFNVISKEHPNKQKWLSLQSQIDSMKMYNKGHAAKIYPFNPNFITDYKGYKLGMSVQEIDRLLNFRKENKFVNSAKEFQAITQISDSLLQVIAPYFKFPNWVNHKKGIKNNVNNFYSVFSKKRKTVLIDINQATKEDLVAVYGIGEVISSRILNQKEKLGAFVSMEQMNDIWGLSPEVIVNLNTHFKVLTAPKINKININKASIKELSHFFYFTDELARKIVKYRSMNGDFNSIEDLAKINDFPMEKAKIINLYLDF